MIINPTKKIISFIILCSGVFLFHPVMACADLEYHWKTDVLHLNDYQDINLYRLNLKNMTVEVRSDSYDGEEKDVEGIDEEVLQDIANEFFARFVQKLDGVMPLSRDKKIDPGRKSLVTELELSGKFIGYKRGLLMKMIFQDGQRRQSTQLAFKCIVKDSQTDQVMLELSDEREFTYNESETPLKSEEDFGALSELIEFWSKSFAAILSEKKQL